MKKILPWLKSNLLTVIALAVAIIGAPVMLYFAAGWNTKVRDDATKAVSNYTRDLDALEVQVQIDPVSPGDAPISARTLPNDATIQAVSSILDARRRDSETVVSEAVKFNRANHKPLIDGENPDEKLFPDAESDSTRSRLLKRLIERWPKAHAELLENIKAGMPPSVEELSSRVEDARTQEIRRRVTGREEQKITPEEDAEIAKMMVDRRLQFIRQAARPLTVYASPEVFKNVRPWTSMNDPTMEEAWEWQWIYWVNEDIVSAVAKANTDPVRGRLAVYEAPVKRIESINVLPMSQQSGGMDSHAASATGQPAAAAPAAASTDASAQIKPDYTASVTGRAGWPKLPNPVYDVRQVEMTVLVALDRLPTLIDAISQTNFMTVTGVQILSVPARPDLIQGYDYGGDYLVQADLKIETVWLRQWTTLFMPKAVRTMLGIPDPPAAPATATTPPANPV
ncbi:MAG TPA: hypothetical protein VG797_10890 [Phycisphaerales bacterium]|nr:hypothetical protein [Phycisphaerales bacterium]